MNYPKQRYTGEKPWMNKDWLYEQYITLDRSSKDIADEYGCKQNTIQCWLLKHGIKKQITTHNITPKHEYETYEYLYDNFILKHKMISEIAQEANTTIDTITYHLKKFNLWVRSKRNGYTKEEEDLMIKLYCEDKLSANQISKVFHTSHRVIIDFFCSCPKYT